ncbi:uncharacterized protein RHO25_003114 [Cercospora beticola]|uniref:F-box domain-containing protein n=1 Tax=Cercospora beticola TaxID=122368 RepID=A0ABZ0NG33_CERBT|nr:hypothetical protein RHO25_003114 [Cercospora beticola]CAK1359762.1 unnamed protein product [Cercospora beticola]
MSGRKRRYQTDDGDLGYQPKNKQARPASSQRNATSTRITRLMVTDATRQAVFNTAELLELIFTYLSPHQLLQAQIVSQQFRDIVKTSKQLQEILYLRIPDVPPQIWVTRMIGPYHRFQLPELHTGQPSILPLTVVELNKTLVKEAHNHKHHEYHAGCVLGRGGERVNVRTYLLDSLNQYLHGEPQSWETMHICSPKATFVEVAFKIAIPGKVEISSDVEIEDASGLTLGKILQKAIKGRAFDDRTDYRKITALTRPENRDTKLGRESVEHAVRRLEKMYGRKAVFLEVPKLLLRSMVVPSEEQRQVVNQEAKNPDAAAKRGGCWRWPYFQ